MVHKLLLSRSGFPLSDGNTKYFDLPSFEKYKSCNTNGELDVHYFHSTLFCKEKRRRWETIFTSRRISFKVSSSKIWSHEPKSNGRATELDSISLRTGIHVPCRTVFILFRDINCCSGSKERKIPKPIQTQ